MLDVPVGLPGEPTLLVSEVFGPTVQGEGPSLGRRCCFVRLGLCNLDCSWCDTPYTWDWTGKNGPPQDKGLLERLPVSAIVDRVLALDPDPGRVVISGGEPLVQRKQLGALVRDLDRMGCRVEIETNGTLMPTDDLLSWVGQWNVSPKLLHSGVATERGIVPDVLREMAAAGAAFKVVCATPADLDETHAELVQRVGLDPWSIWIMPEGRQPDEITPRTAELADKAIALGFNLTTRLHVLAWGDERGR